MLYADYLYMVIDMALNRQKVFLQFRWILIQILRGQLKQGR